MEAATPTRILVVEDDPDIREILVYVLTELSRHEVRTCARGDEALRAAMEFHPDLIVLDAMLPGMDGTSVLRAARQSPQLSRVPFVFLTARTRPTDIAEYREAGAVRVFAKPFDLDALPSELDRAILEHRGVAA